MISVDTAFSVEEVDPVRKIAQSVQVAWKKSFKSTITFFTIGVSRIGGTDIIPNPSSVLNNLNLYQYDDESSNVLSLGYERQLNIPEGGLVKGIANVLLDNTSGRYTPRYAGGSSAIFTALLPQRPLIINAGFNYGGIDNLIPQYIGATDKPVVVDARARTAQLSASDYISFLQNKFVDNTAMFTGQRSDVVLSNLLAQAGFSTAQYDLDVGVNNIEFGIFNTGDKFADVIDQIVKAEYGQFYQDEQGIIRFDNRQRYSTAPFSQVQRVITTNQVINSVLPDTSHIINVVEVTASPRAVGTVQLIWSATGTNGTGVVTLVPGVNEIWVYYSDPIFSVNTPVQNGTPGQTSYWIANSASDGSATDVTASMTLNRIDNFSTASKLTFNNLTSNNAYLTTLDIWGKPASKTGDIYYRAKTGISVTAFGEQVLTINNDYIQSSSWAQLLASMILSDFSSPDNLQTLTIRAIPELQIGDLISWQGHYWRIFGIKTQVDPGVGFIQDLLLVSNTNLSYFRIGISTIGGTDRISG